MKDRAGRLIDYMRVSLTDRCNLRCTYCMPEDVPGIPHASVLRYEEILRICDAAGELGIRKFKVTGGEPFVRKDASWFISRLAEKPYADAVTVTTNGILLEEELSDLVRAGVAGINISLDAISPERFEAITGTDAVRIVLKAVRSAAQTGLSVKTNTVLLKENEDEWLKIVGVAETLPICVRFIECMPCSFADPKSAADAPRMLLERLRARYPDLHPVSGPLGNGPAAYYGSDSLQGYVGLIAASSQPFCADCNRVRLTAAGRLIGCLGSREGTDLRTPLRNGAGQRELAELLSHAIYRKPSGHHFSSGEGLSSAMHTIGG